MALPLRRLTGLLILAAAMGCPKAVNAPTAVIQTVASGVQIGQVVAQGYDLQKQWLEQLEHFHAVRDAGFDFVSWGHHWLIHPFQHFQPIPVLARFAAERRSGVEPAAARAIWDRRRSSTSISAAR